jgi:hypothetical protein
VILKTFQRTLKRTNSLPSQEREKVIFTHVLTFTPENIMGFLLYFTVLLFIEKLDEIGLTVAKKMKIYNKGKSNSVIGKKRRFLE